MRKEDRKETGKTERKVNGGRYREREREIGEKKLR